MEICQKNNHPRECKSSAMESIHMMTDNPEVPTDMDFVHI